MIAKKSTMKAASKTSILRLVEYLNESKVLSDDNIRVANSWTSNLNTDDIELATQDILAVQSLNNRSKADKTYHLIISFGVDEKPDEAILKDIEKHIAKSLGYEEHQRIVICHDDTNNFHIHMAINKIHPETFKAITPKSDYKRLSAACSYLEEKYNLKRDNHRESSEILAAKIFQSYNEELNSFHKYAVKELDKKADSFKSWQELHDYMGSKGLGIKQRGNGLVVFSKSNDKLMLKASSISKEYSYSKLVNTLGTYQENKNNNITPKNNYVPFKETELYKNVHNKYRAYKAENIKIKAKIKKEVATVKIQEQLELKEAQASAKNYKKLLQYEEAGYLERKLLDAYFRDKAKEKAAFIRNLKRLLIEDIKKANPLNNKSFDDWSRENAVEDMEILKYLQQKEKMMLETPIFKGDLENVLKLKDENNLIITRKGGMNVEIDNEIHRFSERGLLVRNQNDSESLDKNIKLALKIYGQELNVDGKDSFKNKVLNHVVNNNIICSFKDKEMQKQLEEIREKKANRIAAVYDYCNERNSKRENINNILEHVPYTNQEGVFVYQGYRKTDKGSLILLKDENTNKIVVKAMDKNAVTAIKNINRGDKVEILAAKILPLNKIKEEVRNEQKKEPKSKTIE